MNLVDRDRLADSKLLSVLLAVWARNTKENGAPEEWDEMDWANIGIGIADAMQEYLGEAPTK